ncbi:Six-hairpin glycosidase-like protein [Botryosphaeria dothidea]|uniref:Six-hairpin glycosidase-like protein n=1 Tax=Botryosphaeria dothidea TaxID=55169 RepID=A0A8H4N8Q7_9PEZI|nr:Six-hairpin glycosidase-like protein [Botryosphaeria dothidea]
MKSFLVAAAALAGASLASAKITLPNGWFKISPDEKINPGKFDGKPRYLTWMANSQIKHGVEPTFAYTVSAYLSGIKLAYDRTGDEKYYDYLKRHTDIVLYPAWNGEILLYNNSNSIDDIRFGPQLPRPIDRTGRNPDGGFYHRYPVYIDQMWLDGIYMLDVFYARWTHEFEPDNTTAWDDIALQFDLIDAGTTVARERTGGLPLHGFDYSKRAIWADPETGAAPHVWGRAVGWYIMALVDTLDYFPETHPGRARLIGYLQSLSDAERSGNYIESSGSSMFVYGLLKGLRFGYIEGEKYLKAALDGYELMTETFAEEKKSDGSLDYEWTVQTGSLSSNGTFEYYASIPLYENDLKGVSPFLFSSYEYELYVEGKK